jgi:hypothetical protein
LRVVEKETVDRAIATVHECLSKSSDVQSLDSLFSVVSSAKELYTRIGMIRIKISDLAVVSN